MALATILAPGLSGAVSTNIVLADGQTKTVGMFAAGAIPGSVYCTVTQATPGLDNRVTDLTPAVPAVVLAGPGTFRVSRPVVPGTVGVGIFTEG